MSLVLQVDILGEYKNLTAATKGAQTQLSTLNNRAKKISNGMNKAFAAIGVGFSLRLIINELEEAAKAAIEDEKSQKLLATAMENTGKATKTQVAEAEKAISKMQLQSSVADDKLRPAYQKLFIATGDVTESNRLLQIALDASAGSGKSLDTVSQAMAKSLAGNDTALVKLIPSLKGAKDPLAELAATFDGAAEAAANTDPYQRMQIIFGEMQEQIGVALLPLLNEFSDWLATPEGQAKLEAIVTGFKEIITEGTKMVQWVLDNKDWLVPMVVAIGAVTTAWKVATAAVETYQALAGLGAIVGGGAAAGAGVAGVAAGSAIGGFQQGQQTYKTAEIYSQSPLFNNMKKSAGKTIIQNVTIQALTSAREINKTLVKQATSNGTKLLVDPRGL